MGRCFITQSASGGIPTGGTTGQVLVKKSNNSYDVEWSTVDAQTLKNGANILFYCGTDSNGDYVLGSFDKWQEAGSPTPPSTTFIVPKSGGLTTVYVNDVPIAGINLDDALVLMEETDEYIGVDTLANVINDLVKENS